MPGHIHKPGHVGFVSRSGTLTYEAVGQLSGLDIGHSTCIGIGGDPIIGTRFTDSIKLFNEDPATHAIIMIVEIGGVAEEAAATICQISCQEARGWLHRRSNRTPRTTHGTRGRHYLGGSGKAEDKLAAMTTAGIVICPSPAVIGENDAGRFGDGQITSLPGPRPLCAPVPTR